MHINGISSILASLILGNVDFTYFCCFSWYASLATSAFTRSCYRFSELRFMLYLTEIWLGFSKFLDGDAWRSALFDLRSSRSLHHHLTSFGKSWHWVAVLGTLIVIDSSSMKIPKNFPKNWRLVLAGWNFQTARYYNIKYGERDFSNVCDFCCRLCEHITCTSPDSIINKYWKFDNDTKIISDSTLIIAMPTTLKY